jgi:phosphatidate phosphatase APP1
MINWKQALTRMGSSVEDYFDALKFRMRQERGIAPAQILPYIGHGTRSAIHLRGRAIEDYTVSSARDNDTVWQNLLNMYRRFNSHEIPHARIKAIFEGHEYTTQANEEGFFEFHIRLDQPLPDDNIWHDVALELTDYRDQLSARTVGKVIIPPLSAQFGVISDLDDTVIRSDVVNLIKLARNTFLYNSHTRLPFAGVAEFYHALQRGVGQGYNPIYYVSNSPWNLYDLLVDFFEVRGIPPGTFFLTDLGLSPTQLIRQNAEKHKLGCIQTLLETHPQLPFILIGDSGEHDPEIYLKAAERFPGRIRAIYIRDVSEARRDKAVQEMIDDAARLGAEMLLVPDTAVAAAHAAEKGFISSDALPAIRQERREDKGKPTPIEALVEEIP